MNNDMFNTKCWLNVAVDKNDLRQIAAQVLPHEEIKTMNRCSGNNGTTMEINHEWIIKLPRSCAEAKSIQSEIEIAKVLADADLPVPVSQPVARPYVLEKDGKTICGLAGVMPRLDGWTPNELKGKLMEQSAEFLVALHAVPVQADGPIKSDWNLEVQSILENAKRKGVTDPSFKQHLQSTVFTPFYKKYTQLFHPVLCHRDFHTNNILVDLNGNLSAVLDFGNAKITYRSDELVELDEGSLDELRFYKIYKELSGHSLNDIKPWRDRNRFFGRMKEAYLKQLKVWMEGPQQTDTRSVSAQIRNTCRQILSGARRYQKQITSFNERMRG